ncbi:SAV2-like protein [Mya arenaria]|uniref:SAV2-like protein n=1 Tax=Mya arenaria TaxID=6604 RepID=A0ABY7FRT7_MYAAR|nr:streptavidin-V2-like [Mya arenaria]XP_052779035.1 streptavidin-V2-like [Mya arenaria]WAR24943.1 SAV2-like protein [Mya arenaria]
MLAETIPFVILLVLCYLTGSDAGSCSITTLCEKPIPSGSNQCGKAGTWQNELTSVMKFTCRDGQIEGKYCSAVGKASYYYPMAGRYLQAEKNTTMLGWTVSWANQEQGNSQSATSWTGLSYGGQNIIHTQWLLMRYSKALWNSTMLNTDTFKKIC